MLSSCVNCEQALSLIYLFATLGSVAPWIRALFHYSVSDRRAEYCNVRVCVCVCLSAIISSELHVRSSPNLLRMLPMAVARSSSGGVVIRYVLPVLWMLSQAKVARRRRPAEAQCTHSLGRDYNLCAVIPVAGRQTHWTTFRALKVTSQVAEPGAESAVYDWLVIVRRAL